MSTLYVPDYVAKEEEAKISYNKMFTAYIKTFLRMGLTPISLRAETGQIGGNLSHEFQILAKTGESTLYYDKELETLDPEKINPENRPDLKQARMLTRDAREVERKKYGQPGARKKFQFSKR